VSYHIDVLKAEFKKRSEKNARFSLRSYAAKLELHPSALSRILAGKQEVSQQAGVLIVQKLGLTAEESRRFLQSIVESRKQRECERLGQALNAKDLRPKVVPMNFEDFHTLGCLTAAAVMELTQITGCKNDAAWIAKRLGADEKHVREILQAMMAKNVLTIDGDSLKKSDVHTTTVNPGETAAIRQSHQEEILKCAVSSLRKDPFGVRGHYGMTMAVDPLKIAEANQRIHQFMEEICDFLEAGNRTEVYQLGIQIFPLTTKI
jgi:uncharacterized protein (TIGR02147 family)